ncbi:MAG: GNAT family N-acetyltransferase [Yaniella sp.]|uniref:bifunctional acetate--CoA ligase family protein/GNAT family N-acetyltransferase n=1 Tax=Yaniella sp. TaxID=2773929 RepID=UPI00264946E0|nr:GNAT family N-acetyltransferase [Yaniella sp.]MDN5730270.1 GNAT family N-acetyltransferase [Yaniella sp.]MDN5814252.1 GNAT family N-acetyltransferase [Yaniella sp.]MDN5817108.1 GNAT family N-acetyltransferase [Yaniella sp.]MDN5888699.1 GNAT family N-acetyltransferase [Yaniella sp.]MDN5911151.1 GNAT family N-acetyltransferase [Yaniella sp.]
MAEQKTKRPYPAHWEADVLLRDGATARLRPVSPDDADALQKMHEGQSQDSIYFRYFTYKSQLSAKELERFTVVDYVDRVAFVILLGDELMGIGRYDRLGDATEAEVAFNIADAHQGRGLSSIFMEHLAAAAKENGIRTFTAEVLPENRRMLAVFQAAGFETSRSFEDGVVVVEFPIDPTARVRAVMESREHRAEAQSVAELLRPESIAVIGASRQWGSVGFALLENIIEGGYTGPVYGINKDALEIAGMISRAALSEVPQDIDLAVVAVPYDQIPSVVQDCAEHGVKGLVIVTEGFKGEEGLAEQRRLVQVARRHGMRVIGPASAGIINTDPDVSLNASVSPTMPRHGSVGLFSQSAPIGAMLFTAAQQRGIGISSMINAGNRADVSGNDAMQYLEDDPNTSAVGLYLESFGNPRKFSRIVRRLARKKPVVVSRSHGMGRRIPPGHSTRTTEAPRGTVPSMLRQAGAIETDSYTELIDILQVLACQPVPAGPRLTVIGNAPAINRLTVENARSAGLEIVDVQDVAILDAEHSVEQAIETLTKVIQESIDAGQTDSIIVLVQPSMYQSEGDARMIAQAISHAGGDTDVSIMASFTAVLERNFSPTTIIGEGKLRDQLTAESDDQTKSPRQYGLPLFSSAERAVAVLSELVRYRAWRDAEQGIAVEYEDIDRYRAEQLVTEWTEEASGTELVKLSRAQTDELLSCYGIGVLPSRRFQSTDQALDYAQEFGYPVALKADNSILRHRLDLGGVRLNIETPEALRANIESMREVLAPYGAPSIEIQAMAPPGQGCIVAAVEDPLVGPVLSFGISGDAVELLDDWVHVVPPLSDHDLERLLRTPQASAKLFGYGDIPAVDIEGMKDLLARVSQLKDDLPQVARLRFNPLLAAPGAVTVLKAEIYIANAAVRTDSARRALLIH